MVLIPLSAVEWIWDAKWMSQRIWEVLDTEDTQEIQPHSIQFNDNTLKR